MLYNYQGKLIPEAPPVEAPVINNQLNTDMHKVAVDMYKMEKDQYWIRCNVFLLLNSALLVAYESDKTSISFSVLAAIAGAILSLAWLAISIHSEYYIKRWREIIRNIELNLGVQPFLSFPKDSVWFAVPIKNVWRLLLAPVAWFARGGSSRVMNGVIVVFILM